MHLRHEIGRRQRVVDVLRIGRRTLMPVEMFDHRQADALHDRAFDLTLGRRRMNHRAAVDDGGDFFQMHLAGAAIDFNFNRLRRKVVGTGFITVAAMVGELGRIVPVADADDGFAAAFVDVGAYHGADRLEFAFGTFARADLAVDDG